MTFGCFKDREPIVTAGNPFSRFGRRLALLVLCLAFGGCAIQQQSRQANFDGAYLGGDYQQAAKLASGYGGNDTAKGESGSLLWSLQQATALQNAGDYADSIRQFDATEAWFKRFDLEADYQQWLNQVGAVLSNDAALDYRGTVYDAIMVNTYKALDFLALGNDDDARVELNRARDRQRRAGDFFAKEIQAEQSALYDKENSTENVDVGGAVQRAQQLVANQDNYLDAWRLYPDFINPFATWLDGLFLMTVGPAPGDLNQAADALKATAGMVPKNAVVRQDHDWAEQLASGTLSRSQLPDTVWVLFENGLGPVKRQVQVGLPIVIGDRHGYTAWAGFAYPKLVYRRKAAQALRVSLGAGDWQDTTVLSNMDAVVSTEFAKRLPGVVTRAVISSITKAVLEYQLSRKAGPLAGLLGFAYQVTTLGADTRIWSSLPKSIELAKLERNGANRLQLSWSGGPPTTVQLPASHFVLVWVRLPEAAAKPAITVIPLGSH